MPNKHSRFVSYAKKRELAASNNRIAAPTRCRAAMVGQFQQTHKGNGDRGAARGTEQNYWCCNADDPRRRTPLGVNLG